MTTEIKKRFSYFPLTKKAGSLCMLGCDKLPSVGMDGEYLPMGEPNDCKDCLFWCFPITFVIDVVGMPFRGTYHIIRKCK